MGYWDPFFVQVIKCLFFVWTIVGHIKPHNSVGIEEDEEGIPGCVALESISAMYPDLTE